MKHCLRYAGMILLAIILLFALAPAAEAKTTPEIRVLLSTAPAGNEFTISVGKGGYELVESGDDDAIAQAEKGDTLVFGYDDGQYRVSINGEDYSSKHMLVAQPEDEDSRFSFGGTSYRGGFQMSGNGNYGYAVNVLGIEEYLYGVVGRELGYNYHMEALKAQAVASRSYALSQISGDNLYYDVTGTISSQVYGGADAETPRIREAVDDTEGMILTYDGEVVMAYFSSNAGGYTENIENVWLSDAVPLLGVPSPFDAYSSNYSSYGASCYSWTVEYTPDDLVRLANRYGQTNIGEYVGISMSTRYNNFSSVSGRALVVSITGSKGTVSATKDSIRTLLDLKSTLISISDNSANPAAAYVIGAGNNLVPWETLEQLYATSGLGAMLANGDKSSIYVRSASGVSELSKTRQSSDNIVISGKGYGHGVGLSQWGAIAMADNGYDWEEIIEHYYCSGGIELTEY